MRSHVRKILRWCAGALLLLLVIALLFPCTNCQGNGARKASTSNLITNFEAASRGYKLEYGSYPSGDLKEVVSALRGANPRHIVFMEFGPSGLNQAGEPVDGWKTPLRLVRRSDGESPPEFLSAGIDRIFGTADDLDGKLKSQSGREEGSGSNGTSLRAF